MNNCFVYALLILKISWLWFFTDCINYWIAVGWFGNSEPNRWMGLVSYRVLLCSHLHPNLFTSMLIFYRDICSSQLSFLMNRLEKQFSSSSYCPHYLQRNQGKAHWWIKIDSVPWLLLWPCIHLHQGMESIGRTFPLLHASSRNQKAS
jgi:hypothetical protein